MIMAKYHARRAVDNEDEQIKWRKENIRNSWRCLFDYQDENNYFLFEEENDLLLFCLRYPCDIYLY